MKPAGDEEVIRSGLARRLDAAELLIPPRPAWRAAVDGDMPVALVRIGAGTALRAGPGGHRTISVLATVGAVVALLLAYGLFGAGTGQVPTSPRPSTSPTAPLASAPLAETGLLRPVIEPRLTIPVRPESTWTVIEDRSDILGLVYLLEAVGSGGFNVGMLVIEPHGVYDPIVESSLLPMPADLMGWIADHPDLDAGEPFELTVAGMAATAIDVTVTYASDGPKGQTAQFINIGPGPWNLESPSRKRIVLVQLPDRPLLIVFDSRPEFFDAAIGQFEAELARIVYAEPGPAP
jgi:hypothetical protein